MTLIAHLLPTLRSAPHQADTFQVLADGLLGSGDPRGELINLHARGDRVMAEVCVQRNARALLGSLANLQRDLLLDWELGFIRRATLSLSGVPDTDLLREPRLTTLTRELLSLESSLFLEELVLLVAPTARVLQGVPGAAWNVGLYAPFSLTRFAVLVKAATARPRRRGRYFGAPPAPARFGWELPDDARIVTQLPLKGRRVRVETDWTWVHDVMRDVFKSV